MDSAKPVNIQPEVIPEEYDDEQNLGGEGNQEDGANSGPRFTSPEASAERLTKLPQDVQSTFQLMTEETIFAALVNEVQFRCQACREKCSPYDFERMWTQMVRTY